MNRYFTDDMVGIYIVYHYAEDVEQLRVSENKT